MTTITARSARLALKLMHIVYWDDDDVTTTLSSFISFTSTITMMDDDDDIFDFLDVDDHDDGGNGSGTMGHVEHDQAQGGSNFETMLRLHLQRGQPQCTMTHSTSSSKGTNSGTCC